MQIVVIGEAVNNLSDEFKDAHYDLPWHRAVGLRNKIAHGYFSIKPEIIWQTVEEDLPQLKQSLHGILEQR